MESWFLDANTPNSTEMVLINFLAHSLHIAIIQRKSVFFTKSHKNAVISVFWHVEFISALKTELNPTIFEKNAKNKIIYLIIFIFFFFFFFFDNL